MVPLRVTVAAEVGGDRDHLTAVVEVGDLYPTRLTGSGARVSRVADGAANVPQHTLPLDTRLSHGSVFGAMCFATNCPARLRQNLVLARDTSVLRRSGSTKRSDVKRP